MEIRTADVAPPRPQLCVGAIATEAGRLLLVRRARPPGEGGWSVPGGRVEAGETLVQAVLRELAEETGLGGTCGPLVGWVERYGPGYHYVILDFTVTVAGGGAPVPGDDAAEAAWVPLDELDRLELVDGLETFLREHGILRSHPEPDAETTGTSWAASAGTDRRASRT